jgi:hypothetical protein
MRGAVAVSTAAPPDAALQRLAARTAGRIVIDGVPVDIGGGIPRGHATVEILLDELPGAPRLILPAVLSVPPLAYAMRGIALAALLAGLGAAAVLWRRARRPRRTSRGVAAVAAVPAPAAAAATAAAAAAAAHAAASARTVPAASARTVPGAPGAGPTLASTPRALAGGTPPRSGAAPAPPLGIAPRVGRYEPLSRLGEGGTSAVYLARATGEGGFERRIALKVLLPHLAREERQRTMFLDEARIASCIDHPNVIQILDLGHAEGQIYIAMEHVDGADLESTLGLVRAEGRLVPLPIAVAILQRICAGLHAAHTAADLQGRPLRVVHRDVKPGNVLVSRTGAVKVSDFGIAKARQQIHTSLLGEARGTAAFMAPEQRLGQVVDARTDVFGVAAIGYELISSLQIDLDLARLSQYGTAGWPHLPSICGVRPEVPPALEQLVFRGLAFTPAERPASCEEIEGELARIAAAAGWLVSDRDLAAWVQGELARRTRPGAEAQGPSDTRGRTAQPSGQGSSGQGSSGQGSSGQGTSGPGTSGPGSAG